jgi:hypothetical protein
MKITRTTETELTPKIDDHVLFVQFGFAPMANNIGMQIQIGGKGDCGMILFRVSPLEFATSGYRINFDTRLVERIEQAAPATPAPAPLRDLVELEKYLLTEANNASGRGCDPEFVSGMSQAAFRIHGKHVAENAELARLREFERQASAYINHSEANFNNTQSVVNCDKYPESIKAFGRSLLSLQKLSGDKPAVPEPAKVDADELARLREQLAKANSEAEGESARQLARLRAEVERMRPVVEATVHHRRTIWGTLDTETSYLTGEGRDVIAAVDSYLASSPATDATASLTPAKKEGE